MDLLKYLHSENTGVQDTEVLFSTVASFFAGWIH